MHDRAVNIARDTAEKPGPISEEEEEEEEKEEEGFFTIGYAQTTKTVLFFLRKGKKNRNRQQFYELR